MSKNPPASQDRLSVRDVMEILRVKAPSTVYSYVHRGLLPPPIQQGKFSFWLRKDLDKLLNGRRGLRPTGRRAQI